MTHFQNFNDFKDFKHFHRFSIYFSQQADGELRHYMGSMQNESNRKPLGLQIYFHDNNQQLQYRSMLHGQQLCPLTKTIIGKIQKELLEHNEWLKKFQFWNQRIKNKKIKNFSLVINSDPAIQKGVPKSPPPQS